MRPVGPVVPWSRCGGGRGRAARARATRQFYRKRHFSPLRPAPLSPVSRLHSTTLEERAASCFWYSAALRGGVVLHRRLTNAAARGGTSLPEGDAGRALVRPIVLPFAASLGTSLARAPRPRPSCPPFYR